MLKYLNYWYARKVDVIFLRHIQNAEADDNNRDWAHHYNLVVRAALKRTYNYSEDKLNSTKDSLIERGYLIQKGGGVFITEEGQRFLQDYYRFKYSNILKKISAIFGIGVFATILGVIIHGIWKFAQKYIS